MCPANLVAASALATAAMLVGPPGSTEGDQQTGKTDATAVDPLALAPGLQSDGQASRSLARGLAWLAGQQQENGSFPQNKAEHFVPVAVTSLAALAMMAGGSAPDRGPHGTEVSAAIDYLLGRADLTEGAATRGYVSTDGDKLSRMHGHGLATLALAQAYSMSPKSPRGRRTERVLEAAVELIEKTQGPEGGWYYEAHRGTQHEGSVTICLVQALRGARNAGIHVDTRVIGRAIRYVERSQNEDGTFRYALNVDRSSVALTAAAVSTLNATGQYSGPVVERGMEALWQRIVKRAVDEEFEVAHPFYERFYLSQAFWQHSDLRLFEEWNSAERERVIARQGSVGSWKDPRYGDCYATAINCLFLALPQQLLPLFQR